MKGGGTWTSAFELFDFPTKTGGRSETGFPRVRATKQMGRKQRFRVRLPPSGGNLRETNRRIIAENVSTYDAQHARNARAFVDFFPF